MTEEQKRSCPRCESNELVKSGKHLRRRGVVQRYRCKICGTSFTNDGYFRGKHPISLVQYAVSLYVSGHLSCEKVRERLKEELGISVSSTTICNWLKVLKVEARERNSSCRKNAIVRDLLEIGIVTTLRYVDSKHPEKFMVLTDVIGVIEN